MPSEVQQQLQKIEDSDIYEFREGLDVDSHSYVYRNALNQFKYENENLISFNSSL